MPALLLIDATSWIDAWLRYPLRQFPRFWEWIAGELADGNMQTVRVVHKEVEHKIGECSQWLGDSGMTYPDVSADDVLSRGVQIKGDAGITGDIKDNPRGIDDNDLELIAVASLTGGIVVTEEHPQMDSQKKKGIPPKSINYKIPMVCRINDVECTNFLEVIKASGRIF